MSIFIIKGIMGQMVAHATDRMLNNRQSPVTTIPLEKFLNKGM